jgi:hypothetical protein
MFTWTGCVNDVDHASRRGEIGFGAARGVARKGDTDFEIGADGHVEARDEGGAAAAQIFAGSFFFKDDAAAVAPPDSQREADGDSTLRALPRGGLRVLRVLRVLRQVDHGRGPLFWRSPCGLGLRPQSAHFVEQPLIG